MRRLSIAILCLFALTAFGRVYVDGVQVRRIQAAGEPPAAEYQAFSFGGAAYVQLPVLSISTNVTVMAWVFPSNIAPAGVEHSISWYGGGCAGAGGVLAFYSAWDGTGLWQIRTPADACANIFFAPSTGWVHYAVTVGDGKMVSYINGLPIATNTDAGIIDNSPVDSIPAKLAGWPDGTGDFNGFIDDVRFASNALSASQIAAIYEGAAETPSGYAQYRAPLGTLTNGQIIADLIGDYDGTNYGATGITSPLN